MRTLIAPDSFKDATRADRAARAIADGVRQAQPDAECDLCPVSDGGEGFVAAMAASMPDAQRITADTTDPLGRPIGATYALAPATPDRPSTAVIELAAASGLELLALHERDPMKTTTFGTGTLIRHALDQGAERILLGIGGSATSDAGLGIAQALGRVRPANLSPLAGGDMASIARELTDWSGTDPMPLHPGAVRIACDVTNPFCGPNGAAYVYGPQKGAAPQQVKQLDAGLRALATAWRDAGLPDVEYLPGAGAAGGVGGGLVAMLGAELCPGAELVLDAVGFDDRLARADFVLTGEGKLDSQSLQGKAAMAVAARAKRAGIPCVALVGCVGEGAEQALDHGLTGYRVIGEGLPPLESIARTAELLTTAAADVVQRHLGS